MQILARTIIFAVLLWSAALPFGYANAQIFDQDLASIYLEVYPPYPKPGEEVQVYANSRSFNLTGASFSWSINGAAAPGAGRSVKFTAGSAGSATTASVNVRGADGRAGSASVTIRPAELDLLWETNTYVPPWYKGKALPTNGSSLVFWALPHVVSGGNRVSSDNLIFTWEENGSLLSGASGRGRDTLRIPGPKITRPLTITVTAKTIDGGRGARSSATIQNVVPELLLYEEDPLLGTRHERAIAGDFSLEESEVTISAHPFYASVPNPASSLLEYRWRINGNPVSADAISGNTITLRNTGVGSGQALIDVVLQNTAQALERAAASFRILFGSGAQEESANPFGNEN